MAWLSGERYRTVSPVGRKRAAITLWIRNGTMLVLSRKKDEKIVIGDNISIMVVEIRGDKVRLGIDAPRDVSVHRREVYDAISRGEPVDSVRESAAAEDCAGEIRSAENPHPAEHRPADPA